MAVGAAAHQVVQHDFQREDHHQGARDGHGRVIPVVLERDRLHQIVAEIADEDDAVVKEVSKEDLPVALRGASPDVKEKFLKNMSSRASEMLKEDMEARGPAKVADVEKAQQNILKVCRKLEEEGRIVISGAGEALV